MSEQKRSLVPGIILIGLGLWMVLDRLHIDAPTEILFPAILVLFALFLLFETVRLKRPSTLFWGIALGLIGGFYLARNAGWVLYLYPDEYWPLFPLAIGLGFVGRFIMKPSDWGVLIPGALLLMVGGAAVMEMLDIWWEGWHHIWRLFWPLLFIALGAGILIRSFRAKKDETPSDFS